MTREGNPGWVPGSRHELVRLRQGGRKTGLNVDAKRSEAEIGKQGHIKRPAESDARRSAKRACTL